MLIDPKLKDWATPRQAEIIDAVNLHGSHTGAGRALGIARETVASLIGRLKIRAAAAGYSPANDMTRTVPPPFLVKGVSTYYDREGNAKGQWVKTTRDQAMLEEMQRAAISAMSEEVPRVLPLEPPDHTLADLCNLYTITDAHVGALAWHKEGGADWDLKFAERTLTRCFEHMIMSAPPARVAVVNQQGDFLHTDGLLPITPTSGHMLDADGRFSKIVEVAIRIVRRMVDMALMRHEIVHVVLAEGNHDISSSVWLRHMFSALYENEPRVTVDTSPLPYYVFQHGKVMLAIHHGHLKKNDQLPLLFAAQFPVIWGLTTKRYCHTGHRHHIDEREHAGMTVTQHATLAARDAFASRGGWISERQAQAITYHSEFGQVARNIVSPEMVG